MERDGGASPEGFLDWLRAEVVRFFGAQAEDFPALGEFANTYRMAGEKVVAVDTVYELNDKYYA